jgi:hypothetical protein
MSERADGASGRASWRGHAGLANGRADKWAGEQAGSQSERVGGRMSEQARGRAGQVNSAMKTSNHNRICFAIDDGMIANQLIKTKKNEKRHNCGIIPLKIG